MARVSGLHFLCQRAPWIPEGEGTRAQAYLGRINTEFTNRSLATAGISPAGSDARRTAQYGKYSHRRRRTAHAPAAGNQPGGRWSRCTHGGRRGKGINPAAQGLGRSGGDRSEAARHEWAGVPAGREAIEPGPAVHRDDRIWFG